MDTLELSYSQFQTVYNVLSLALAAMVATFIFLLAVQGRVLPRYRQALVVSAMVCLIAAYHYYRIFNSFTEAYVATGEGTPATGATAMSYVLVNGEVTVKDDAPTHVYSGALLRNGRIRAKAAKAAGIATWLALGADDAPREAPLADHQGTLGQLADWLQNS